MKMRTMNQDKVSRGSAAKHFQGRPRWLWWECPCCGFQNQSLGRWKIHLHDTTGICQRETDRPEHNMRRANDSEGNFFFFCSYHIFLVDVVVFFSVSERIWWSFIQINCFQVVLIGAELLLRFIISRNNLLYSLGIWSADFGREKVCHLIRFADDTTIHIKP